MSILEKWSKAIDERDIDGMSELIHDDYEFSSVDWETLCSQFTT